MLEMSYQWLVSSCLGADWNMNNDDSENDTHANNDFEMKEEEVYEQKGEEQEGITPEVGEERLKNDDNSSSNNSSDNIYVSGAANSTSSSSPQKRKKRTVSRIITRKMWKVSKSGIKSIYSISHSLGKITGVTSSPSSSSARMNGDKDSYDETNIDTAEAKIRTNNDVYLKNHPRMKVGLVEEKSVYFDCCDGDSNDVCYNDVENENVESHTNIFNGDDNEDEISSSSSLSSASIPRKRSRLLLDNHLSADNDYNDNVTEYNNDSDSDAEDNDVGQSQMRPVEPEFSGTLPLKFYSSPSISQCNLNVRGKSYVEDHVKIPAEEPAMELVAVDLLETDSPVHQIADLENCTAKVRNFWIAITQD